MVRAENGDYEMVNLLKKEELLKCRKYVVVRQIKSSLNLQIKST